MEIRKLSKNELEIALKMVWKVFCEYEAVNYPESGKEAFYQAIHSEEYLAMLEVYGALCDEKIVGIMATRNEGTHVALFFVDGQYHRKGIGKKLWEAVLSNTSANLITVHSSLYASEIYKKLGFYQTDSVNEDGGIQYIPMEYNVLQKAKEDIISALAQPWTLHDRIGLSRLICSKDKLKLEEIDQIRITHYIDDYAFLDGNMIWKETDVCKLAELLIKIMEIPQKTINALLEDGNFDGLKKNVSNALCGYTSDGIEAICSILMSIADANKSNFKIESDNGLLGKTVIQNDDGITIRISKTDEGKICKAYYNDGKHFLTVMKTGKGIGEEIYFDSNENEVSRKSIELDLA